jgi:hypothetical protein
MRSRGRVQWLSRKNGATISEVGFPGKKQFGKLNGRREWLRR